MHSRLKEIGVGPDLSLVAAGEVLMVVLGVALSVRRNRGAHGEQ